MQLLCCTHTFALAPVYMGDYKEFCSRPVKIAEGQPEEHQLVCFQSALLESQPQGSESEVGAGSKGVTTPGKPYAQHHHIPHICTRPGNCALIIETPGS